MDGREEEEEEKTTEHQQVNRLNTRRETTKTLKKYELIYLFPECGKTKREQHNEITISYIHMGVVVIVGVVVAALLPRCSKKSIYMYDVKSVVRSTFILVVVWLDA